MGKRPKNIPLVTIPTKYKPKVMIDILTQILISGLSISSVFFLPNKAINSLCLPPHWFSLQAAL